MYVSKKINLIIDLTLHVVSNEFSVQTIFFFFVGVSNENLFYFSKVQKRGINKNVAFGNEDQLWNQWLVSTKNEERFGHSVIGPREMFLCKSSLHSPQYFVFCEVTILHDKGMLQGACITREWYVT